MRVKHNSTVAHVHFYLKRHKLYSALNCTCYKHVHVQTDATVCMVIQKIVVKCSVAVLILLIVC